MLYPNVDKATLKELYSVQNLSMMQISKVLGCSHHKVAYWMTEYKISRRSISQAVYLRSNPNGDPFKTRQPKTTDELILYGLGIGLYWGEGTKSSKNAVRLGNSDPILIKIFTTFLMQLYGIDKNSIKYGLQIFSDINPEKALQYWADTLNVKKTQFYNPIVTISGSIGTYRNKSKYGVVTINFGNTKLRNILVEQIAEIAQLVEHVSGNDEVTGSNPVLGSIDSKAKTQT